MWPERRKEKKNQKAKKSDSANLTQDSSQEGLSQLYLQQFRTFWWPLDLVVQLSGVCVSFSLVALPALYWYIVTSARGPGLVLQLLAAGLAGDFPYVDLTVNENYRKK